MKLPSQTLSGIPSYDPREHYERVKALHERFPLRTEKVYGEHAADFLQDIYDKADSAPEDYILRALYKTIIELFKKNDIYEPYFITVDWNTRSPGYVQYILRPYLIRNEARFSLHTSVLNSATTVVQRLLIQFLDDHLPDVVLDAEKIQPDAITVPLIDLMYDPIRFIHNLVAVFISTSFDSKHFTFPDTRSTLYDNLVAANGLTNEQVETTTKTIKFPMEYDGTPQETAFAYLKNTIFLDLLFLPVPFTFDDQSRLEHFQLCGGSGHGKTQSLQSIILNDLKSDNPPALVIIDPKGEMLDTIQRLEIFDKDPDRLVIIDPRYDPALNMFDMTTDRIKNYSPILREQVQAGIIELYSYIFSALEADLSTKMGTAFSYLVRLVLSMPNSTIKTFLELLEENPKELKDSKFAAHLQQLDPIARLFFEKQFFEATYRASKVALARRIYEVLSVPAFVRMFTNSPVNRFDMYEAIASKRVVLVNTSQSLLKGRASALFGRWMIAQTMIAVFERAAVPVDQRHPAYLIVDEASLFFDESLEYHLAQARGMGLGLLFAHQNMSQLSSTLRSSIAANTSIKMAGGVSDHDARALAPDMRTTHDFIMKMRKVDRQFTELACFVRNKTSNAIRLRIPFGAMEAAPKMSETRHNQIVQLNKDRYSAPALLPPPEKIEEEVAPQPPKPKKKRTW